MQSIKQLGLINPIVLDDNDCLIAGERRLTACRNLGMTSIEARRFKDLAPSIRHLIELEENIIRADMPWQDTMRAVQEYHSLRVKENMYHTSAKTAEELRLANSTVHQYLKLALQTEKDPSILENKKVKTAVNKAKIKEESRVQAEMIDLGIADSPESAVETKVELLQQDFVQWSESEQSESYNFIHCDFPYGINLDKSGVMRDSDLHSAYTDSQETFLLLLDKFLSGFSGFAADQCHVMFWCASKDTARVKLIFEKAGFACWPQPLIWHKSDTKGISPDYRYFPRHVYETAIIASRGDRKIFTVKDDLISSPNVKQLHRSEKPKSVLRHFFSMFIDQNTRLLDPTMGCGNAIKIAKEMGAHSACGIEIDPENFVIARTNINMR